MQKGHGCAAEDGGCIKSELRRGPQILRRSKPDLGAAHADRGRCGAGGPAGSRGAQLDHPWEDPGSGGDGRRRRPGARTRDQERRYLGAPGCEQTGPPRYTSEAEAVPVTLGPPKRIRKCCGWSGETGSSHLNVGAGQGNPRLTCERLQ
ncbi:hypothetical protein NDU88_002790 [Pleurodeles waltl]|uniref:Uncharacterized protein n=1 Tax=Pleurodeles waltl TaxID=8319 RepID=A0AAV7M3G0_PLEWA|nr:hypothetical protein NDU88_002790 [Pleurodeles waltl]